jgi:CheY-like chemotaxis protein
MHAASRCTFRPPAAPRIGDSDRLRRVVWNILSDAVKFTPRGGRVDVTRSELPGDEERGTMSERWSDLNGRHVLVVDDNEDTRNVLATMLEAHGATVATAPSVADARIALANRLPDVLITDLAMPVEDGFGLLEYCRHHSDARLQSLPILALTAYGGQQAHDRVIAAGFDAYLAKPVEPIEVGRVVRELALRNSSSTR